MDTDLCKIPAGSQKSSFQTWISITPEFQLQEVCGICIPALAQLTTCFMHWSKQKAWLSNGYPGLNSRCRFVLNKLVPKSAPTWHTDPIIRHGSLFEKCIGSNKRSVPNKRTVSSNWNTRVTCNKYQQASFVIWKISVLSFNWLWFYVKIFSEWQSFEKRVPKIEFHQWAKMVNFRRFWEFCNHMCFASLISYFQSRNFLWWQP